ncbi:tRNA (adenosine(37)-N6)-threonylcarbamoyltransferase complex dimerization subunit type 1 TsaB [Lachnospiraceae bacterium NSJ-143]|nr:tRNA (adenosine(37)-N6)-threonylcarbamoyltransferase complex dimerization subunit type 1 TsaB [Lachnospiraceae bacterium NSJ-143]
MKILAIDSSGSAVSAAIADDDKIIAEYILNFKMTHSQTLMPSVDEIVLSSGFNIHELDYIAVTAGPGSFTGLRIGAAAAKGLAHGLGIDIIPVPTLEALAYNIFETDRIICPIMDARRSQVYNAFYEFKDGSLLEVYPQEARSIEDVIEKAAKAGKKVIFLGDAVPVYKERLAAEENFILAPQNCNMQRASSVAALAFKYAEESRTVKYSDFAPFYLRKPQAERELEEKKAMGSAEND